MTKRVLDSVYKVVETTEYKYFVSCTVQGKFCLKYIIGRKTFPLNGSKIFVFDDLSDAVIFKSINQKILKCKYDGKKYSPTGYIPDWWKLDRLHSGNTLFEIYWKYVYPLGSFIDKMNHSDLSGTPTGTILVDWVIPVELIVSPKGN